MENNEITMFMDVKIDKRPECTRYLHWTRTEVKIEAVKCLPCFLRITLMDVNNENDQQRFSLSINVPGVSITLASSRTKQHSYALCWTQNRKCCYIYFALDTELSCRRHMKWVKKSIKNLELHRKLLLDERRGSKAGLNELPMLTLEDFKDDSIWSQRVSEIYEEIYEPSDISQLPRDSRRVSRRCSRTSIASGIYEEMKLPNDLPINFDAINEEFLTTPTAPIPPPLPPIRKRFNTYEKEEEVPTSPYVETPIPRCSTNPETDLAKKKKYRNMLDNIFHGNGLRSKRTVSTSESSQEQLATTTPKQSKTKVLNTIKSFETKTPILNTPTLPNFDAAQIYANDDTVAAKRQKKPVPREPILNATQSKRNSFSSPDLSKINFVDTFDEQRIAEMMNPSFLKCDDFDLGNSASLDESMLIPPKTNKTNKIINPQFLERNNISTQLPQNFNFSACNTSSVNLIAPMSSQQVTKNKIIHDDLTGYCVMAPIVPKMSCIDNIPLPGTTPACTIVKPLESVSSGYSTGTYSSSASSTEDQQAAAQCKQVDESVVYVNMHEPTSANREIATPPSLATDFTGNLYENLMAIKAARELELEPTICATLISTSTPTESPHLQEASAVTSTTTPTSTKITITSAKDEEEEENFYQTPRRSIISIDEKIPSYYPNTCETSVKSRRRSYSPAKAYNKNVGIEKTPTSRGVEKSPAPLNSASSTSSGIRQLVSSKIRQERKENLYLTSPQTIIEQRKSIKTNSVASISTTKPTKSKKAAALKISENVYAVKHRLKKSTASDAHNLESFVSNHNNNNNLIDGLKASNEATENSQDVFEHISILRNINFKFDDTKTVEHDEQSIDKLKSPSAAKPSITTHHLQVNQSSNISHKLKANSIGSNTPMTQSAISKNIDADVNSPTTSGSKKFASLPRFKKFDLSPLRMRIHNVLQRNHTPDL